MARRYQARHQVPAPVRLALLYHGQRAIWTATEWALALFPHPRTGVPLMTRRRAILIVALLASTMLAGGGRRSSNTASKSSLERPVGRR